MCCGSLKFTKDEIELRLRQKCAKIRLWALGPPWHVKKTSARLNLTFPSSHAHDCTENDLLCYSVNRLILEIPACQEQQKP